MKIEFFSFETLKFQKMDKKRKLPCLLEINESSECNIKRTKWNYRSKKNWLLSPRMSQYVKDQIILTGETLYSFSGWSEAEEISHLIIQNAPGKYFNEKVVFLKRIIDGTAGGGGNIFSFVEYFEKVVAIEKAKETYEILKHNVATINKTNRVYVRHEDLLDIAECKSTRNRDFFKKTDILFMDPPWGGPEYYKEEKISLFLSNQSLSEVCEKIGPKVAMVVLKVPFNFDITSFQNEITVPFKIFDIIRRNVVKMKIIFLYYNK